MNNHKLSGKQLDEIENKLLKAALPPDERIEKIVDNPRLFNLIKDKIAAEKSAAESRNIYNDRRISRYWNWQKIGFSFGILLILLVAAGLLVRKTPTQSPDLAAGKTDAAKSASPVLPTDSSPLPDKNLSIIAAPKTLKAVSRQSISQKFIRAVKSAARKSPKKEILNQPPPPVLDKEVFYSLTFPGNTEIENANSQIVRTELSRAALFALGVNVSAGGDESRKYKTDLIVGADGVPQAIRFVK